MSYVPDDDAKNILDRTENRLVEVIGEFVTLHRSGSVTSVGICPLCGANKLEINPSKHVFKCFACNELSGKRPIDFLMKGEHMSYPDALIHLAKHIGYILPDETPKKQKPATKKVSSKKDDCFCNRMLAASGLTVKDVMASVFRKDKEKTCLKWQTFRKGTINGRGEIDPADDDAIIEYFDLDGYPVSYFILDNKKQPTDKRRNYYRVRWQFPEEHLDKSGKAGKYKTPYGGGTHILEECEKLMNIVFVINDTNRSVRILCASSKTDIGTYTIENVFDSFERTSVDDDPRISYKNVCYDLPSSKEYKYQNIDESILEKAVINESKTYTDLVKKLTNSEGTVLPDDIFDQYYNSNTLFYVTETDTYYVLDKYLYKWLNSPTGASVYLKNLLKVNTFRKYTSNPDDDYLKLSFFPCLYTSRPNDDMYVVTQRMPYLPGNDDAQEEEAKNIRQLIENGVSDFNASKKPVALCTFHPSDLGYYFTLTDNVADNDSTVSWYEKKYGTFRLVGPEGLVQRYYQPSQQIDATKEYTIKFIINTMPNIQAQFLLNNKLFICKELEYRITNDGIHPEVTGTFYAILN